MGLSKPMPFFPFLLPFPLVPLYLALIFVLNRMVIIEVISYSWLIIFLRKAIGKPAFLHFLVLNHVGCLYSILGFLRSIIVEYYGFKNHYKIKN